MSKVYVVIAFDTEGPVHGKADLFDNWGDLDRNIKLLSDEARYELKDSAGEPAIFSWFIVDWFGYSAEQPSFASRGYDAGINRIYDHYFMHHFDGDYFDRTKDGVYWHYHHPGKDGSWDRNSDWNDSSWYEEILTHKLLDRQFFPLAYRSGSYIETNDCSKWLERWIPFDYSSNAPVKRDWYDWSAAPVLWTPYHPSFNDYQRPGTMRRYVMRNIPIKAKGGSGLLTQEEVDRAFLEASIGKPALFACHSHDFYQSAIEELRTLFGFITNAARRFPKVSWEYRSARDAMVDVLGLQAQTPLIFDVKRDGKGLTIDANREVFGTMPYVAVETNDGRRRRIDVKRETPTRWSLSLSPDIKHIGIAANDAFGHQTILSIKSTALL